MNQTYPPVRMSQPDADTSRINLMLVDDKEISNFILRKTIEKNFPGHANIYEFCNGTEAFNAITSVNPSLIFLDLCLPNFEDGYEFLQKMRDHKFPHAIAILTSSIDEEHQALVHEYPNVINFISKPISSSELVQTIELSLV